MRRFLDFVLYILIETAICGGVIWIAMYTSIDGEAVEKAACDAK